MNAKIVWSCFCILWLASTLRFRWNWRNDFKCSWIIHNKEGQQFPIICEIVLPYMYIYIYMDIVTTRPNRPSGPIRWKCYAMVSTRSIEGSEVLEEKKEVLLQCVKVSLSLWEVISRKKPLTFGHCPKVAFGLWIVAYGYNKKKFCSLIFMLSLYYF